MIDLLIDTDSKIQNLALMKKSTHSKQNGHDVFLNKSPKAPDEVWISCLFTWNKEKALGIARYYESCGCKVHIGGTGISKTNKLPPEIESQIPDFSLYPDEDSAVGFAQRGCNRKCEFCFVPEKEGWIRDNEYRPVHTWNQGRTKIRLLDNNMAQSPHHDDIIQDCRDNGLKLSITQGYDIRCMTPERARMLAEDKPWSLKFKERRLYIAWDYFFIEPYVTRGIEQLLDAGFKGHEIMCYCLAGFNTTPEQDMYRVKKLDSYGVLPYIMPYNRNSNPNYEGYLSNFTRWVNRRYYKFVPWEKYKR